MNTLIWFVPILMGAPPEATTPPPTSDKAGKTDKTDETGRAGKTDKAKTDKAKTDKAKAGTPKKLKKADRSGGEVNLRTEPRGRLQTAKEDIFEIELRPKALGQLALGRHRLKLVYNPRLNAPVLGPSGGFTHFHRGDFEYSVKATDLLKVSLKQRIEGGLKNFKNPLPSAKAIDDGLDEMGLDEELLDEVFGEDEDAGLDDDDAMAPSDDVEALESGDDLDALLQDDEAVVVDKLPDEVIVLSSTTTLGIEGGPSKKQTYKFTGQFVRSGGLDATAKSQFPERLAPIVALEGKYQVTPNDALVPSFALQYNTFDRGTKGHGFDNLVGRVDFGYQRKLAKWADLKTAVGFAGARFAVLGFDATPADVKGYLYQPNVMLGLGFKPSTNKAHKVKIGVNANFQPFVNPVTGTVIPRLLSSLSLDWKSTLGVFAKGSFAFSKSYDVDLTRNDDQGYQLVTGAAVGYAYKGYVAVETGFKHLFTQRGPNAKTGIAPDPAQKWAIYLALTVGSGFWP